MKWILALFSLSALLSVVLFAGISRSPEIIPDPRVRYRNVFGFPRGLTDCFSDRLNILLTQNLLSRFPKDHPYYILDFEPVLRQHTVILQDTALIRFTDFKTRDQKEAVSIALQYYRAYIDAFNNTREIRPYLREFPVPLSQYRMDICFARDPHEELEEYMPYLHRVYLMSFVGPKISVEQFAGRLYSSLQYVDVYDNCLGQEPEELKESNPPRLEKADKDKPIEIPCAEKVWRFNSYAKGDYDCMTRVGKLYNLKFISLIGALWHDPLPVTVIGSGFSYAAQEQFLSIEQVRELLVKISKEHCQHYYKVGLLQRFVNECRAKKEESLSPEIDAQKYLGFRISFWDKYIDRVKSPSIAEVRVLGKKARYYVADEYQRLQLIHEEELPPFEVEIPVPKELLSK